MIKNLFLEVINMSITASVVILAVIVLRWLFRKLPKIYSYLLWSMVLFRLLCPYSFSLDTSAFNLLPAKQTEKGRIEYTVPEAIVENIMPQQETDFLPEVVISPQISTNEDVYVPQAEEQSQNIIVMAPRQKIDYVNIFALLWLAGVLYMIADNLISLYEIKLMLANSQKLYGNVYKSDVITTAFIIGVISPKIYLPKNLSEEQQRYIIFHEETHLKRKDYLFKYMGFLALALHWFNPLVWLAYYIAEKDMEMSCDEAVIKWIGSEEKRGYSQTLLSLSMPFREYRAMHLAFGEGETKQRIVNILSFKKPQAKCAVAIMSVIAVAGVVLVSNPTQLNAKQALALNDENISDIVLVEEDECFVVPDSLEYTLVDNLKRTKISVSEENSVNKGTQLIYLKKDGNEMVLNFNEGCSKMWITAEDYENSTVVYDVRNPEIINGFIHGNVKERTKTAETHQIVFPVDGCQFCEQVESFMVNVELPQGWYFYNTDKTPDSRSSLMPHSYTKLHLINEMNETVGAIGFAVANGVDYEIDSAETIMQYISDGEIYMFDISQYKVWPNYGEIALASVYSGTSEYKNYCALATKIGVKPYIIMTFLPDKISWEQAQSIASSIDIRTVTGGVIRASNLSYWIKPDETEEVMVHTAVSVYMDNYQAEGCAIENVEYAPAGDMTVFQYPVQLFDGYDYVVKVEFINKNENKFTNYIYIDKTEATDYSILGCVEETDKKESESYSVATYRLKKVLPAVKTEKDNALTLGMTQTVNEGESGLNLEKVIQTYHNGMVVSEQVVDTTMLKESQPQIVKQGTMWNGVVVQGGSGKIIWPTEMGRVSRGFVDQYPQHNGIDIAAPVGTHIYAADTGVVTKALYTDVGYGIYCIIEHGGYQTLYAQCSELLVQVGQKVQQGQIIAKVGSSGNSTGSHLHFEVKKGNVRYNPYDWF